MRNEHSSRLRDRLPPPSSISGSEAGVEGVGSLVEEIVRSSSSSEEEEAEDETGEGEDSVEASTLRDRFFFFLSFFFSSAARIRARRSAKVEATSLFGTGA